MSIGKIGSPVDIAVSGLQAQARRLKVIGNNIANAETESYERKTVTLSTGEDGWGVGPGDIRIDANMSKVQLPIEMMRMMAASRAYQANAAVLKRYQESIDVTLELLK